MLNRAVYFLVALLVAVVVVWCVFLFLGELALPATITMIVKVIVSLIALLGVLYAAMRAFGMPPSDL